MYSVSLFLVVLGLLVGTHTIDVYNIFEQTIDIETLVARMMLNETKNELQKLNKNTNADFIMKINSTITSTYNTTVGKYNLTDDDQDCLIEAKYSADNLILDSIEELIACQGLTQAYDKVVTMDGSNTLETKLNNTRDSILKEALKCKQQDFSYRLSCMQRKANSSNPSLESITKEITTNFHKIGGLGLLVNVEYTDCQNQENIKLSDRQKDVISVIQDCFSVTNQTSSA